MLMLILQSFAYAVELQGKKCPVIWVHDAAW